MEAKLEKERREREDRIEKKIQDEVNLIKKENQKFLTKDLPKILTAQTEQITKAIAQAVG